MCLSQLHSAYALTLTCAPHTFAPQPAALEEGDLTEEEALAQIMGVSRPQDMSEVQQRYKDKIKAQVARVRRCPMC